MWLGTTARPKVRQHFRSSPGRMWLHRDAQIEQRTGRIDRLGSLIDRWRKNGDNSARREERSKALCCLHRAAHARCVLDPQLPISFPSSLELSLRFWPDAKDCIRRPLSSPCPEMSSCPGEIEAKTAQMHQGQLETSNLQYSTYAVRLSGADIGKSDCEAGGLDDQEPVRISREARKRILRDRYCSGPRQQGPRQRTCEEDRKGNGS